MHILRPSEVGASNLVEVLRSRAEQTPSQMAFTFLADGETASNSLAYQALWDQAAAIGDSLRGICKPGDRTLLLFPPGLEFVSALLGCLHAGVVAVPTYAPRASRPDNRLQAIADDAQATVALTDSRTLAELDRRLAHAPGLKNLRWISTDQIPATGRPHTATDWRPDTLALLQYTSGSTATPKGVMLSHANLLENLRDLDLGWGHTDDSVLVSWLPTFHDLGLVYGVLMPIYRGIPCYLMPPAAFLQRPARWLEAISRYRGTHSAAPNFAYELCVAKVSAEQRKALDLLSWRMGLNAAEPVRADTLERFNAAFGQCGLSPQTLTPGYGLAEATLKVTACRWDESWQGLALDADALARRKIVPARAETINRQVLVGCGRSEIDGEVVIVEPEMEVICEPDQIGEIWVCGSSIAQGYWNRPDETRRTFQARLAGDPRMFLRTGDLGFVRNGQLFIAGRLKDLIIIRGLNHYPQDIERTVEECHPALRRGCGAAFAMEVADEERLVVVQELERIATAAELELDDVLATIRQAVAAEHDLQVHAIALLRTASIPKTSSGKIQRGACRIGFQEGTLNVIREWHEDVCPDPVAFPISASLSQIEATLRNWLAPWLKVAASKIDVHQPFARYGIDSITAVRISGELASLYQRRLPPTLLYDQPTVRTLARYLAGPESATDPIASQVAEPIAIVGLGCRFPGAASPAAYWELLASGVDAVTEVPPDRWDNDEVFDPNPATPGKTNTRWGSFLDEVDQFDADFFGLSRREAEIMDPQQRLLLEVAWEAFEDAGIASYAGSPTGVFIGISTGDYGRLNQDQPAGTSAHAGTGNALSIAANRLSYFLDLRGPSLAIDTACSSSLVAVHQACESLRRGECDMALAGGVNLILSPDLTVTFSQAGMLSPDGRCKTFDAAANGYVRGEGCGIIVLKRLSQAIAAGDRVLAVVRGSAVNQDGRSNGLTAPNGPAQQAVVRRALARAGVEPREISYVEAHGTATSLGDPIEANALVAALSAGRTVEPCWIGSVKTNIGHLEAAAGIAGLIKVALALTHRQLPKHLHLANVNPHLSLAGTPFAIPTSLTAWPGEGPRRAGVSSFGFGGTNAHAILEEGPAAPCMESVADRPLHMLTISAKTEMALSQATQAWRDRLATAADSAADLCFTANVGRTHFEHRLAVVGNSREQLCEQLAAYGESKADSESGGLAFLFTGQGSQYAGMGRELFQTQPVFRAALEQCEEILRAELQRPLLSVMFATENANSLLDETEYAQPALFSLEFALAELWKSWGIVPAAVLGHSVGEYVAACVAGMFPLEEALKLVATRGRLMQRMPRGRMAAVAAGRDRVAAALDQWSDRVSVAAVNGPSNTVISGEPQALEHVLKRLESEGIVSRPLQTSHAFHSPLVEPILDELGRVAQRLVPGVSPIRLVANLTGELADDRFGRPEYWRRHARAPVEFARGMETLARLGFSTFLEIGPSPVLLSLGRTCIREHQARWFASLRRGASDWQQMLETLAQLYVSGATVDWAGFDRPFNRHRVAGPTYPFQRQRYWSPDEGNGSRATDDLFYESQWTVAPSAAAPDVAKPADPQNWLIFADRTGLGEALAQRWRQQGRNCQLVFAGQQRSDSHFERSLTGVVHVDVADNGRAESVLELVQNLARRGSQACQLCLVTRGVTSDASLVDAPLWGLAKSIALEYPQWHVRSIDLPLCPGPGDADRLCSELAVGNPEEQVALSDHQRLVPRLVRWKAPAKRRLEMRTDGTYLITGGCGAIGLQLAGWLVRQGAHSLVLCGRSEPSPVARQTIAKLREQGVAVLVAQADVADRESLAGVLARLRRELPPLKGVFHAAGVAESSPLANLTSEQWAATMRPKVAGGSLLHELTADDDIEMFVCFSSIAAVWGAAGQAPYVAANQYLDALAHHRRANGQPALSINWGPWSGSGMASESHREQLARMGVRSLSPARALAALGRLLATPESIPAQVMVADIDWSIFRELFEVRGNRRLLEGIASHSASAAQGGHEPPAMRHDLAAADPMDRRQLLIEHVRQLVAQVLGRTAEPLPLRTGFFALGIDSLLAVELRNRLSRSLGLTLPATLALEHPHIEAVVDFLSRQLDQSAEHKTATPPIAPFRSVNRAEPIAIVGIGCRFPGEVTDADSYWHLLRTGTDAVGRLPAGRWPAGAHYQPRRDSAGTMYTQWGGFLDQETVEHFDAAFFGISPREAASLDPQQRLLLAAGYEALENSVGAGDRGLCARTGVFVGITSNDYAQLLLARGLGALDSYFVTGNSLNAAAGRLSFLWGLQGPSLAVDTACSSSLVAVHLACQSLRQGECDQALAGGVNLILSPGGMIASCQAQMLSPDGRCKTFDATADGYGRGEGCGVVVLKRLADALAAGNEIWAVIRGSAVNQDGSGSGFTVPSGQAQQTLIRTALAQAELRPDEVDYVEAHGTGTALGDPIEVAALSAVYCNGRASSQPLWLGSAKTNLGHLESAAGIAGLIKTALMLRTAEIPPHLHLRRPNPHIPWSELPLRIPSTLQAWPVAGRPRRAGVSAFGFSGTNAHVVLEQAPPNVTAAGEDDRPQHILTLSAKSPTALTRQAQRFAEHLRTHAALPLADVCFTANLRRHYEHRLAIVASSPSEAAELLARASPIEITPGPQAVAFRFGNLETRAIPWGRELYRTIPAFRRCVKKLEADFQSVCDSSLRSTLDESESGPLTGSLAAATRFCVAYCEAKIWEQWVVTPAIASGAGIGQYVAACVAGVFTLVDALRLVTQRARVAESGFEAFDRLAAEVTYSPSRLRLLCPTTGQRLGSEISSAAYWQAEVRSNPPAAEYPEISNAADCLWLTVGDSYGAWDRLLQDAAALYLRGVELDWRAWDHGYRRQCVSLPTYPFHNQRYWFDNGAVESDLYELVWQEQTARQPQHVAAAVEWLILADDRDAATRLADLMLRRGQTCHVIEGRESVGWVERSETHHDVLRRMVGLADSTHPTTLTGIIHLGSLNARLGPDADLPALDGALQQSCRSVLDLAQTLVQAELERPPRLWLVTRGAVQRVGEGLGQSPVWGLGKVLSREHTELGCTLVDLDPETNDLESLCELLLSPPLGESQFALRADKRLTPRIVPSRSAPKASPLRIRPDRSYLISGGLGEIGLHVAQWLAERGAKHLMLAGRHPPSAPALPLLKRLRERGATVDCRQVDVADPRQVAQLLATIPSQTPLAGVIHAAGVLADRMIVEHEWRLFEQVFAPKIHGAWNLHQATRQLDLDLFVLCSSASTFLPPAGMANYVAANEFLDALSAYRRAQGLPSQTINWGPWAGVGMAAGVQRRLAEWSDMGLQPLAADHALKSLAAALDRDTPQLAVMSVDWQRLNDHPAAAGYGSLISALVESSSPAQGAFFEQLAAAPPADRPTMLVAHLHGLVGRVLGWPADEPISRRKGFFDLGMDSLRATELRNLLQTSLACSLPATLTFRCPNLESLQTYLAEEVLGWETSERKRVSLQPAADPTASVPATVSDQIADELFALESLLQGASPH